METTTEKPVGDGLCLPIVGMHRSGTSCLSRILNRAGVEMGDNLLVEPRFDNLLGHWEPLEMMEINDRILAASGGSWNAVPAELVVRDAERAALQAFLRRFANARVFGWKEPRFTITFPVWRPYLSRYRLVACVRHPNAVAQSLAERGDGTFDAGLQLWKVYNERLLQYADQEAGVFWFDYDGPRDLYAASLRSLCEFAGLTYRSELLDLFNPCLTHHAGDVRIAEPRAREIYHELIARARRDSTHANPESQDSSTERHLPQLTQFAEVLRGMSLMQNRDRQVLLNVEHRMQSLESRVAMLADGLQKLTEQLGALSNDIQELSEQSERARFSNQLREVFRSWGRKTDKPRAAA